MSRREVYSAGVALHAQLDEAFEVAAVEAFAEARQEALEAGIPVFYRDSESGANIMERPDGRKFEIRYSLNAPSDKHYEIIRELSRTAA